MVGNYIVSFIGFLPANDPEVVVYVAIDNPKGVTQYGGTVAAPVAKNILKETISILNIPESEEVLPKSYTWLDIKYNKLPNVVGTTLEEGLKLLKEYTVEKSGIGNNIIYQSPNPNTYVEEKSVVKIMLGE